MENLHCLINFTIIKYTQPLTFGHEKKVRVTLECDLIFHLFGVKKEGTKPNFNLIYLVEYIVVCP